MTSVLEGDRAIVTGASKGIGRATAARLIADGAIVGTIQRGAPPQIGEAASLAQDLTDPRAAAAAIEALAESLGGLDILVCNAGMVHREPALEVSLDDWERIVAINLTSVFAQAQAAARIFQRQEGGGRIVLVGSMMSYFGGTNVSSYTASKGGIALLTKSLANEWAPLGIRVNAVAPGWTETPMAAPIMADPVRNASIVARIPVGRWAKPEELAAAIAFLVSPDARYVHGHLLPVNGGYLAR